MKKNVILVYMKIQKKFKKLNIYNNLKKYIFIF